MADFLGMPSNKTAMEQLASTSTIRAPQWGSAAAAPSAPTNSLWNMFSEPVAVPKLTQQPTGDPQVPGGFAWNPEGGDEGSGGDGGDGGEDELNETTQSFWQPQKSTGSQINTKLTSAPAQKSSVAAQGPRRASEALTPTPPPAPPVPVAKVVTPVPQSQPVPASANKKGKGKKGKGKKVTIEEVPDDDADKNIDHLPVDSRVIFEPSNSPDVLSNQKDSIIGFGDEDQSKETTSASFAATPSMAASSPPDLFSSDHGWGGAAADTEIEGSPLNFGWGGANAAWNHSAASEIETQSPAWGRALQPKQQQQQQTPVWGQTSNRDKGKGKLTDLEQGSKVVKPAGQNLKRGKQAAGGKLF
jgi:hypothetical protein